MEFGHQSHGVWSPICMGLRSKVNEFDERGRCYQHTFLKPFDIQRLTKKQQVVVPMHFLPMQYTRHQVACKSRAFKKIVNDCQEKIHSLEKLMLK